VEAEHRTGGTGIGPVGGTGVGVGSGAGSGSGNGLGGFDCIGTSFALKRPAHAPVPPHLPGAESIAIRLGRPKRRGTGSETATACCC
jgi:hypothetical protein